MASASATYSCDSTKRRPALWVRNRRRASATMAAVRSGRHLEGLQAVAHLQRPAQAPLAVADGLGEHLGHAQVALDPGRAAGRRSR